MRGAKVSEPFLERRQTKSFCCTNSLKFEDNYGLFNRVVELNFHLDDLFKIKTINITLGQSDKTTGAKAMLKKEWHHWS